MPYIFIVVVLTSKYELWQAGTSLKFSSITKYLQYQCSKSVLSFIICSITLFEGALQLLTLRFNAVESEMCGGIRLVRGNLKCAGESDMCGELRHVRANPTCAGKSNMSGRIWRKNLTWARKYDMCQKIWHVQKNMKCAQESDMCGRNGHVRANLTCAEEYDMCGRIRHVRENWYVRSLSKCWFVPLCINSRVSVSYKPSSWLLKSLK